MLGLGFGPLSSSPISAVPAALVSETGLFATGVVGAETITFGYTINLVGVKATGRVGIVSAGVGKTVTVTGVRATGAISDHVCLETWSVVDTLMC
jgi:hypothetical protein